MTEVQTVIGFVLAACQFFFGAMGVMSMYSASIHKGPERTERAAISAMCFACLANFTP